MTTGFMRSYQFAEYGKPLTLTETPLPTPRGDEVLLRVQACGVCHSDVHVWQGAFDLGNGRRLDVSDSRSLPFTLGHEIVGEVVAMGETASGAALGETRVAFPWIGCGACVICTAGNEHLCLAPRALGTHVDGGFADHVVIPHGRYLFEYGPAAPVLACTYACSGVAAYGALLKARDRVGDTLVLIGAGGVGFAGLQIAKALFDTQLIVVDIDDAKLEAATDAGASHVVNASAKDAPKLLRKLTGGGGSAVIDFVGSEASATLGLRTVAKSGILVVVGLFGGALQVPLPLLALKDLTIRGSDLGSLEEMHDLMELVRAKRLDPIPLTRRPLHHAQQSLQDLIDGNVVGRIVLEP